MRNHAEDRVGLSWFTTVRWTTVLAAAGAIFAGRSALEVAVPLVPAALTLGAVAISNVWLTWRVRQMQSREYFPEKSTPGLALAAAVLMCADVTLLSWLLLRAGGVLNPASVFYLVEIVVAALVLGRRWTWIVTSLSVAGYALLFLSETDQLQAAQSMHPEIALHMRGMWLAFALTALVIAALVTRLTIAVERRDRALESLRERNASAVRVAGLATLAAGAAHELSTPLSTIAVAARELERALADANSPALRQDARLIRAETDRCRAILDAMAGQSGDPAGETLRACSVDEVLQSLRARVQTADRSRVTFTSPPSLHVTWPIGVVSRALGNLVDNALQASPETGVVRVDVTSAPDNRIQIVVVDQGAGMNDEQLARAGEPFFTTKPAGKGTGLGLFVARSTAEQLGGSLRLISVLGTGTTATMELPADVASRRSSHGV
jgi:two-component system sensor histidine kinase RegB